jgi:hypothetical protein
MSDPLAELEAKITAVLEKQLAEAIQNRDSLPKRGFDPKFWNYQAIAISTAQRIERRKNRNG